MTNTTEETMDYTKAIAYLTTLVRLLPSSCFQRGGGFTEAELQDPAVYSKALDVVKREWENDTRIGKTIAELKRSACSERYDDGYEDGGVSRGCPHCGGDY